MTFYHAVYRSQALLLFLRHMVPWMGALGLSNACMHLGAKVVSLVGSDEVHEVVHVCSRVLFLFWTCLGRFNTRKYFGF